MAEAALKENAAAGGAGADRRLSPRHRCAAGERHRDRLRRAGHPDFRSAAHGAGRRHPGDLVPPRAERRQCRGDRGFPQQEAGHLHHRLGAGLSQRPHRARQCHHQLLPDDPDLRLLRARDRRPAAGRLRGDGPTRHRQAAVQGRLPRAARGRYRHRHRARDPRCGVRTAGRRLSRPAGQAVLAGDGGREGRQVDRQGDRSGPGANPGAGRGQARARCAQKRQAPADHPRQGRSLCPGRRRHPRADRDHRHSVPADEHGQGHSARHASAMRRRGALDGAAAVPTW